uniref:Uncharacterized protein n=1 Tax=Populus trichocarpa TaxID=3694 RepID=A0A2K2AHE6_POPTR
MHEGEEEVHLYVDVDPVIDPLMIKVLRHCLGNPEDGKPSETIYCTTYNDEVKNMLLLFYDFNPDKDDMDTEMDDDIGFGVEDEWIDNLQADFSTGQTLNCASDSNNEWKISSDKNDVDVEVSEQFDSCGEKDQEESGKERKKKKNMDPTTSFRYKILKL